jgi:hypothetical protein
MGTITGKQIIDKAAIQLLDNANTRWTRAEVLAWIDDAQRTIVLVQPNATSTTVAMKLVAGTRQQLPADGHLLLDIYRNMGNDGNKPGRVVRVVSRELLDAHMPTWHSGAKNAVTQNYVYDVQDQLAFYVYPPADGNNYVELNYSKVPAPLTDETDTLDVADVYAAIVLDYVLFRTNAKDAEYAAGLALANQYWTAFAAALGMNEKEETSNNPNQSIPPKNQPVPGATS